MALTSPPEIPLITDPSTFATRSQDWVVWQAESLYPFLEDGASLLGESTSTTSTTSNTIGTGSKSFTVETGKGFIAGMSLSIARTAAPTNRMFAVVTSYNSGTGALVVNSQAFEGSGTYTDWSIAQAFPAFLGGTLTNDTFISGASLRLSKGADVASAASLPLITDGNYFDVTGTTTITSFASMGVGTQIVLHFDGALTLTHNATDLILPSGANITTAAGDEAGFIEYASGDWRCVWYSKASGLPVVGSIISSSVVTTSGTTHDFGNGSNGVTFPSTVKRISGMLRGVSTSGTSIIIVQIGDSGGIENTGYDASGTTQATNGALTDQTIGFPISGSNAAANVHNCTFELLLQDSSTNTWMFKSQGRFAGNMTFGAGGKSLSAALDRIRLTTVNGTDTFDLGSSSIIYE